MVYRSHGRMVAVIVPKHEVVNARTWQQVTFVVPVDEELEMAEAVCALVD